MGFGHWPILHSVNVISFAYTKQGRIQELSVWGGGGGGAGAAQSFTLKKSNLAQIRGRGRTSSRLPYISDCENGTETTDE